MNEWSKELHSKGMEINLLKSKVIHFGRDMDESIHITFNTEPLEKVDDYQDLGMIISSESSIDQVLNRIRKGNKMLYSICNIRKGEGK